LAIVTKKEMERRYKKRPGARATKEMERRNTKRPGGGRGEVRACRGRPRKEDQNLKKSRHG
jgi:hypothetical protein